MTASHTRTLLPDPLAPQTLEEAGLSKDLVMQLVLKTLHFAGELTGTALAERLGVAFSVIEPALDLIKSQHQCEVVGGARNGGEARRVLRLQVAHCAGERAVPVRVQGEQMHVAVAGEPGELGDPQLALAGGLEAGGEHEEHESRRQPEAYAADIARGGRGR